MRNFRLMAVIVISFVIGLLSNDANATYAYQSQQILGSWKMSKAIFKVEVLPFSTSERLISICDLKSYFQKQVCKKLANDMIASYRVDLDAFYAEKVGSRCPFSLQVRFPGSSILLDN